MQNAFNPTPNYDRTLWNGIIQYVETSRASGCSKTQAEKQWCNGATFLGFKTTSHGQQLVDQTGDFLRTIKNIVWPRRKL